MLLLLQPADWRRCCTPPVLKFLNSIMIKFFLAVRPLATQVRRSTRARIYAAYMLASPLNAHCLAALLGHSLPAHPAIPRLGA